MESGELIFPECLRLLADWQKGDPAAKEGLAAVLTAAIDGHYDESFKKAAAPDAVGLAGSIDLLTLGVVHDLYGLPKRYMSWPVYGFTAEALGQPMIYSDRFSPGTDPEETLVADLEIERHEIVAMAAEYVEAIKTVARAIVINEYDSKVPPWPGTVYFEDVSAEPSFELIEMIVGTTLEHGVLS